MQLSVVNTTVHGFSPIGISGVILIKENHIAIHNWLEHNYVALDIFTCNKSFDLDEGIQWIQQQFKAERLERNSSQRGFFKQNIMMRKQKISLLFDDEKGNLKSDKFIEYFIS